MNETESFNRYRAADLDELPEGRVKTVVAVARPIPYSFLLLLLLVPLLACDAANPVAPSGTILTIAASPTQIALSGESVITISGFRPDGNPLFPETQIHVSTNLGTLQPLLDEVVGGISIAVVDNRGQARVRLVGDGRRGQAMVEASLTSVGGDSGTVSITVQVGETEEDRPTVVISANPTQVAVGQSSRISLLGRNGDGTPVGAGERIRLTSDLGKLVAAGGSSQDPLINAVFTNENGEAFATFVAGNRGGLGSVSAILGTSAEAMVQIDIRDAIDSLFLSASTQVISRDSSGVQITFTAILQDASGEPVSGTIVNFVSERGSFSDNAVPSNSQGEAQSVLTVTRNDVQDILENGTFNVTATATSEGNTRSDTVVITVQGTP